MGHKLNEQRALFARRLAETGDKRLAARESGYSDSTNLDRLAGSPAVAAEVIRVSRERLASASSIAVDTLIALCGTESGGKAVPAVVRLGAAKAILDRSVGYADPQGGATDPHAMSAQQLGDAIAALAGEIAERERTTIDVTPERLDGDDTATADEVDALFD